MYGLFSFTISQRTNQRINVFFGFNSALLGFALNFRWRSHVLCTHRFVEQKSIKNWHTIFGIQELCTQLEHNWKIVCWPWLNLSNGCVCLLQPNQSSNFSRFSIYMIVSREKQKVCSRVNVVTHTNRVETKILVLKSWFDDHNQAFPMLNQSNLDVEDWSVNFVIDWL